MYKGQPIVEIFRAAAAEITEDRIKSMRSRELTSSVITSSPMLTSHVIKATDGGKCLLTLGNDNLEETITRAALVRDLSSRHKIEELMTGITPRIIGVSKQSDLFIEDFSEHTPLQRRILLEDRVDHGITCQVARTLAHLHRQTHKAVLSETEFHGLCTKFGDMPATRYAREQIFIHPFSPSPLSGLDPKLRECAQKVLGSQQTQTEVTALRQLFDTKKECLVHGSLSTANILVKDGDVKLQDFSCATIRPCAYDLGLLIAHYVIAHYHHMLTPLNNDLHRQMSYEMQAAIQKTMETYMEEQTAGLGESPVTDLISDTAGFAGVELIRRALGRSDPSQVNISDSVRGELIMAGQRLISRRDRINNVGRLLMIGLQLC